jgi:hypothetical protein
LASESGTALVFGAAENVCPTGFERHFCRSGKQYGTAVRRKAILMAEILIDRYGVARGEFSLHGG